MCFGGKPICHIFLGTTWITLNITVMGLDSSDLFSQSSGSQVQGRTSAANSPGVHLPARKQLQLQVPMRSIFWQDATMVYQLLSRLEITQAWSLMAVACPPLHQPHLRPIQFMQRSMYGNIPLSPKVRLLSVNGGFFGWGSITRVDAYYWRLMP